MLELRDATVEDVEAVTRVIIAGFAEYDGKLDPPSGAHAETPEKVRAKMDKGGATVALIEGECVGAVLYYPEDGFLYLGRLAVLPEHRKKGIAGALVEAVEAKAAAMKLPGVQLAVRIVLPRNRAWFESMGYRIVSYHTHPGYAAPTYTTMEKRLPHDAS